MDPPSARWTSLLYDIMGKVMGQPLYRVLGGWQSVVQNDVTIGIGDPEKMAQAAGRYVHEQGYRILKIKAGIDPAEDIRALTLIRQAVGPQCAPSGGRPTRAIRSARPSTLWRR